MNHSRSFGIRIFIFTIMLATSLYSAELDWLHEYDKALEQAKKERKDVYLFIGADTCKFCKRFSDITLSNADVMKRLRKDYVLLYMSRDQHKIPKKFITKGVPRHYFLTPDGTISFDSWGVLEVAGFNLLLDEAELNREK